MVSCAVWVSHAITSTNTSTRLVFPKKRQTHPPPCHLLKAENSNFCSTWWHQMELHKCQNEWQPLWRFGNTLNVFHVGRDEKMRRQTHKDRKLAHLILFLKSPKNHVLQWIIETKQRENNSPGVKLHVLNLLLACRMTEITFDVTITRQWGKQRISTAVRKVKNNAFGYFFKWYFITGIRKIMKSRITSLKGWPLALKLFKKQQNMALSGYGLIDVVALGQSLDIMTLEDFFSFNDSVIPSV